MQHKLILLALLLNTLFLANCAGEPVAPGVCSINCSSAAIAGGRETTRIRLATENFSFRCLDGMFAAPSQQVALFPYPIPVRFIVESNTDGVPYKSPFVGNDTSSEGGEGGGESVDNASAVEAGWTPVPNVSFDVVQTGGALNPCGTDIENGEVNDACNPETGGLAEGKQFSEANVTPPDYGGVVTPQSEWCSDTCGIMTINVWPVCFRGSTNPIALQVRSGGLFSSTVEIPVEHTTIEEPAETEAGIAFQALGRFDDEGQNIEVKRISEYLQLRTY